MSGSLPEGGVQAVFPGRGRGSGAAAASSAAAADPSQHRHHHPVRRGGGGPAPPNPALSEHYRTTALFPRVPQKVVIDDHGLVEVFRRSAAFQKIVCYLQGCAESIFSTPFSSRHREEVLQQLRAAYAESGGSGSGPSAVVTVDGGEAFAPAVAFLLAEFFPFLDSLIDAIPLEDMAQQRFGNRAKREFHRRMEEALPELMMKLVRALPERSASGAAAAAAGSYPYDCRTNTFVEPLGDGVAPRTEEERLLLAGEMAEYLKDAWGNPTRLDYGTGHELHFFLVVVILLEEVGDRGGSLLADPAEREANVFVSLSIPPPAPVPAAAVARTAALRRQMVLYVFQEYMRVARRLEAHYSLEPAGSHGVWGLDDYHHIPYIFGAAQLKGLEQQQQRPSPAPGDDGSAEDATGAALPLPLPILTKYVCERDKVALLADSFIYFQMIQWILENKSGPFFEHSNMLYNISAVERWAKTYSGMVKMYAAEVLSKFNVVQHLLFGRHLPWNTQSLDTLPPPPQGNQEQQQQQQGEGKKGEKGEKGDGFFL